MSRRDRLCLSVVIALSVLQLDGTQWLGQTCKNADIQFFLFSDSKVDYSQPYLSQNIALLDENSSPEKAAVGWAESVIRSKPLLALGLRLIELSLNQTISSLQEPIDQAPLPIFSDLATANPLLPRVEGESGTRYGEIVRLCLNCPFEVRILDLDNEEFQNVVFERIITPLTEELQIFDGKM